MKVHLNRSLATTNMNRRIAKISYYYNFHVVISSAGRHPSHLSCKVGAGNEKMIRSLRPPANDATDPRSARDSERVGICEISAGLGFLLLLPPSSVARNFILGQWRRGMRSRHTHARFPLGRVPPKRTKLRELNSLSLAQDTQAIPH